MVKSGKWIRKGKICGCDTWNLPWHRLNTQLPIPYLMDSNRLRLYITLCDAENRGRLGYVDVNPENPCEILDYSRTPLLDIGKRGYFDENGVVTTCIYPQGKLIYAYYCGFQKHIHYPYSSLTGLAVSKDGGNSFERVKETPLLERCDNEMFIRTGAGLYRFGDTFRLFYAAGNEWFQEGGKWMPRYTLRYLESKVPDCFSGQSKVALALTGDEFGMTSPQIIPFRDSYLMLYSVRSLSYGYRMGCAVSKDGIHFTRRDDMAELERPQKGFDSEMICYGKCMKWKDRIYMFYSGNHYGMDGIGWAELENE